MLQINHLTAVDWLVGVMTMHTTAHGAAQLNGIGEENDAIDQCIAANDLDEKLSAADREEPEDEAHDHTDYARHEPERSRTAPGREDAAEYKVDEAA